MGQHATNTSNSAEMKVSTILGEILLPCIFYLILIIFALMVIAAPVYSQKSPYDWAFIKLDYERREKVTNLRRFVNRLEGVAQRAAADPKVTAFFEMNRHYFNAARQEKIPPSLTDDIAQMRDEFDRYYIQNYFVFYDFLFVDIHGNTFYTLKKEIDIHVNLVKNKDAVGRLGAVISQKPSTETFIDFYLYGSSAEPAAFFVKPVMSNGDQVGWIVMQCSVNKLNSLFTSTDDFGQTGEIFLVNQDGLMLTESFFKGHSTILQQHLDDHNIQTKFQDGKGHLVVTDYRNKTALTSFEVFEFSGTKWLVVAKIDKDEITTAHYRDHKKYYNDQLVTWLQNAPTDVSENRPYLSRPKGTTLRVDMDEFLKAQNAELLVTWGVATCTALVATMPRKFSYLAHMSPRDRAYGGDDTHLLAQVTKRIKSFDTYPYEMQDVLFVVIAPHLNSLPNILDHLIGEGFFLSQIQLIHLPSARSAAVIHDYENNILYTEWKMPLDASNNIYRDLQDAVKIGDIIEKNLIQAQKLPYAAIRRP